MLFGSWEAIDRMGKNSLKRTEIQVSVDLVGLLESQK
jgi:hypothetical protein